MPTWFGYLVYDSRARHVWNGPGITAHRGHVCDGPANDLLGADPSLAAASFCGTARTEKSWTIWPPSWVPGGLRKCVEQPCECFGADGLHSMPMPKGAFDCDLPNSMCCFSDQLLINYLSDYEHGFHLDESCTGCLCHRSISCI